jgi:hypothetical protein
VNLPEGSIAPSPDQLRELVERLDAKLHLFDPLSLLRVLRTAGVHPNGIQFRSHYSTASQSRLVQTIDIIDGTLTITFNFGLLSSQSPLPSYFFQEIDRGNINLADFQALIGIYDHALIKLYLESIYPEINAYLFPNWEQTVQRRIRLQNLRNMTGIHWLFNNVFPDLRLKVDKIVLEREVPIDGLKLGHFVLGEDAVFGRRAAQAVLGFRVSLFVDEELDGAGKPWFKTVTERFNRAVVPILSAVGVDLEILLIFTDRSVELGLKDTSYLGYDRIRGGLEQPHEVVMFRGQLCT